MAAAMRPVAVSSVATCLLHTGGCGGADPCPLLLVCDWLRLGAQPDVVVLQLAARIVLEIRAETALGRPTTQHRQRAETTHSDATSTPPFTSTRLSK